MKRIIFATALLMALGAQAVDTEFKGYDVLSRYKQLEDKLKTHEMLTPYGHDFIFDISAYANKNVLDLWQDANDIQDVPDAEREQAAIDLLNKYEDTEQTLRFNTLVGIPLFSFKAWGVKFVPDLRLGASMGAQIGIKTDDFTADDLIQFVGDDAPAEVLELIEQNKDDINNLLAGAGGDIVEQLIATGNLTPEQEAIASEYKGTYYMPSLDKQPIIHMYTKADIQGGFDLNMYKNRWFGKFSLYGLHRTDYLKRVTAEKLANDDGLFDDAKDLNSTLYLTTDYKVGYKTSRYSVWTSIEEVKLATLSDSEDKAGKVIYGTDPRFRLHGDALFKFGVVSFMPFLGTHYQTDYELLDGLYGGADWGILVWKGRLGIRVRTMLDNEHITLAPKLKFGIGHLEAMLKMPMASKKDGVEPSSLVGANFRLFF